VPATATLGVLLKEVTIAAGDLVLLAGVDPQENRDVPGSVSTRQIGAWIH
jgi:hypothetical protein